MSTRSQAFADGLIRHLTESPPPGWTLAAEHEPAQRPAILGAEEGDLIEVVQPDGEHETYRLTRKTPTADGFGVTFETERVP